MSQDNILHFLNYNYTPFSKKQCAKRIVLICILSIILIFIGPQQLKWVVVSISPTAIISILFFVLIIQYPNYKISRYLCDGFAFLHIAVLLMLGSYRILVNCRGDDAPLLLILIVIFVINILAFFVITRHNIASDKYNPQASSRNVPVLPFIFASGGFLLAMISLDGKSERTGLIVLASCLMILSLMLGVGSLNLMKAYYQVKITGGGTN